MKSNRATSAFLRLALLSGAMAFVAWASFPGVADARLIFTTEEQGVTSDVYKLDIDDSSPDFIDLSFGSDLTSRLRYSKVLGKFLLNKPLDLEANQLLNFRVENLATAPVCDASVKGKTYFDTTLGDLLFCDGTNFISTSNTGPGGKYVGLTTVQYDGVVTSASLTGYDAASNICAAEFTGSHMCRTDEILYTIDATDIATSFAGVTQGWVLEGPPGYTSNSNDCNGLTNNSNVGFYGSFWSFDATSGGAGWLAPCSVTKSLTCCK